MKISLIVAMDKNRLIGNTETNSIPWKLPEDLKYFREKTLNKIIIMGRKTYESIGKPLPKRINYVISSTMKDDIPNVKVFNDLKYALWTAQSEYYDIMNEEVFIIGGAKLYEEALPLCDKLYITNVIGDDYKGNVYFPEINYLDWKLVEFNDQHKTHSYKIYEKLKFEKK